MSQITQETALKLLEALREASGAMNAVTFVRGVPDVVADEIWKARVASRAAIAQAEGELSQ